MPTYYSCTKGAKDLFEKKGAMQNTGREQCQQQYETTIKAFQKGRKQNNWISDLHEKIMALCLFNNRVIFKLSYGASSENTQEIVRLPEVLSNFLWHQDNFQGGQILLAALRRLSSFCKQIGQLK